MRREEILDIYIDKIVKDFNCETREEEIDEVVSSDWSGVNGWSDLSSEIKDLISKKELITNCEDSKYDEIIFFKLRDDLKGVRNEFLVKETGLKITCGIPTKLEICPCCGYRTIENRCEFEICKVCWWEDDGQDNEIADKYGTGVNDEITLTQGRYNFLEYRIYNPKRDDLKPLCQNPEMYEQARIFELLDNDTIIEKGEDWVSNKITKA